MSSEKEKCNCARITASVGFHDMGGFSWFPRNSIFVCPQGRRPRDKTIEFYLLEKWESLDDAGYKFASGFREEASRMESIPNVSYNIQEIPTENAE